MPDTNILLLERPPVRPGAPETYPDVVHINEFTIYNK